MPFTRIWLFVADFTVSELPETSGSSSPPHEVRMGVRSDIANRELMQNFISFIWFGIIC
jgi:hypothetical protein